MGGAREASDVFKQILCAVSVSNCTEGRPPRHSQYSHYSASAAVPSSAFAATGKQAGARGTGDAFKEILCFISIVFAGFRL